MNSTRFTAIGTTAHLLVTGALAPAEAALRAFLSELDSACSRFRPDSTLSTVNRVGGGTDLDPIFIAALATALDAAEATGGLVDPTLGIAMTAVGYDRTFADLATVPTPPTAVPGQAWRDIELDVAARSVRLPRGVRLDLGATAKAWAADAAAARIAAESGGGVLVNLGGDLAIAGTTQPWRVRVTEDHTAAYGGQVVTLRSGGLATSSTTLRTWRRADQVLHHILDPATGLPAPRTWRAVSVAARTCAQANTAATAAVVLGPRAPGWLDAHGLSARLVAASGAVIHIGDWPSELQVAA
ncbi:FAD:protein FMN transferase [Actinokineospora sp. NBRC 105648]|uniref:FAD:protein FMN transferase n=1 Tax=Actinokineospora sp. NBRC 105648 TaxID=3032206 RepID=UPI0024A0B7A3|nr:FAD:protein FMN transferase [Actinokineospora sp. NBRC 105648]GLZ41316.1 FAD:protein FMN transferase [Actinokineospora sp. NBRC 105648]